MTRHIAGRIETSGDYYDGHDQRFELWDDDPDVLVRFYLDGGLSSEECLRGGTLTSTTNLLGMTNVRVDRKLSNTGLRERALGMLAVPAAVLEQATLVGPCSDPVGTEYLIEEGPYPRLVIDGATGLVALIGYADADLAQTVRFIYELDEQVAGSAAPSDFSNDYTESYDYDEAVVAAAFGLPVLPQVPGLTRREQMAYTPNNGERQAQVWYRDAAGREASAQWVEIAHLPIDAAFGPQAADSRGSLRARVRDGAGYLEFVAPDRATLELIATEFRPGLAF